MSDKIFKVDVDIEDIGKRLDIYLSDVLKDVSRSRIQQLIKVEQSVKVNNRNLKSSYNLKYGDEIEFIVPDCRPLDLKAENIPLDIRYEDENMIVVNKPSGMLTHPTSIEREGTLVNALLYQLDGKLSGINGIMRPGIVHRLDRDTSGLLMIAKNDFAHKSLADQIKIKSAKRQYLAVLHGCLATDVGFIEGPIDRHPVKRHKMAIVEGGKHAVTHWKVLERFSNYTFIEATLETGRTHQIRVHFSSRNHPLVGDPLYGGDGLKINTNGQALQAYKLTFVPPGKTEETVVEIPMDDDIAKLLKYLKLKGQ